MRYKFLSLLIFFGFCTSSFAAENSVVLNLTGYITEETIDNARKELENNSYEKVIIYVDSWMGEFAPALKFAQELHTLKLAKGIPFSVYVENRAVGAAAIFPFLADEWNGTASLIWGNVYYGSKATLPSEEMTKILQGFVSSLNPQADLLYLIAQAMVDPNVEFVNQNGWKLIPVSPSEELLILNRTDLSELGFDITTMTSEQFHARYRQMTPSAVSGETEIDKLLSQSIRYRENDVNYIGYLEIDANNPIDETTFLYVNLAIEEFKKKGAIFIILNLNTAQGKMFPAQRIVEVLQRTDTEDHIPVIALVQNWALSQGAMLAYSSRFIGVKDQSLMGAAEPVLGNRSGQVEVISKKMTSAIKNAFADAAEFFGRNTLIAKAMVDKNILLVQRDGKIVELADSKQIQTQGPQPDQVIIPAGKLLTLNGKQLIDLQVADFYLPQIAIPKVTQEEIEAGRWSFAQSLLYHLPFFNQIPSAIVIPYSSWKIPFYAFLCHPVTASFLLIGFNIGIYFALSKLRSALGAVIGFACLLFLTQSTIAYGTADWIKLCFLLVGLMFLCAEQIILPKNRTCGLLGWGITLAALFGLLLPQLKYVHFASSYADWNLTAFYFFQRLQFLFGIEAVALICIALSSRYLTPRLIAKRELKLKQLQEEGRSELPEAALPPAGSEGIAYTSLNPYGKILIQNHLFSAISEYGSISKEDKIIVSKVVGGVVFVVKKESIPNK